MRLQLALNVDDLEEAVDFYTKMFDTPVNKRRDGYANFAIENPPLKLVLFEGAGPNGSLNHLGVETETADQVVAAEARISGEGIETTGVDDTICCYVGSLARQQPVGVVREDRRSRAARERGGRREQRHVLPLSHPG